MPTSRSRSRSGPAATLPSQGATGSGNQALIVLAVHCAAFNSGGSDYESRCSVRSAAKLAM
jgi:hypothetical protein